MMEQAPQSSFFKLIVGLLALAWGSIALLLFALYLTGVVKPVG